MNLKEWRFKNGTNKMEILAQKIGTTRNYLVQIAYEHRKPSPQMAKLIEIHTEGAVTRFDLRPDIYDKEEFKALVQNN